MAEIGPRRVRATRRRIHQRIAQVAVATRLHGYVDGEHQHLHARLLDARQERFGAIARAEIELEPCRAGRRNVLDRHTRGSAEHDDSSHSRGGTRGREFAIGMKQAIERRRREDNGKREVGPED